MTRGSLAKAVEELGRSAITASTPLEAIIHLHNSRKIGTVLTGPSIGCCDGLELLGYVAEKFPSIRRVLLGEVLGTRLDRTRSEAHEVLVQPWTRGRLVEVLAT